MPASTTWPWRSDLDPAKNLDRRLHNKVLLKREDQQPVFSFKLRGAYNKMANLTPEQLRKGVICASAGNHAQGVALGAKKLGCRAVIVMPTTTPQVKIDAVARPGRRSGAGRRELLRCLPARRQAAKRAEGLTFVHPFDDPDVIAGQGTIAMEMLRQLQKLGSQRLDAVFVAIGGGGLISRRGQLHQGRAPRHQGDRRAHRTTPTPCCSPCRPASAWSCPMWACSADGTAVKLVGEETFRIAQDLVDDYVDASTPTPSAPPSRTSLSTRAPSSSPRARWPWPPSSSTWPSTRPRARPTPPSCAAPT